MDRVRETNQRTAFVLHVQYWFDTLNRTLDTLRDLPQSAADTIQSSDWAKLADRLHGDSYGAAEIRQLFYPSKDSDGNDPARVTTLPTPETSRQARFFSSLDSKEYYNLYVHVLQHNPPLSFPDVQSFLGIKRDEGEIMIKVMDHVVRWVNPAPVDIVDRQENNKPLRRQDLVPALRDLMATAYGTDWWIQQQEAGGRSLNDDDDDDGIDNVANWLDKRSRSLEKQVLDYVRDNIARFKGPSMKHYLDLMPEEYEASYAERFADDLWMGLFRVVQVSIGVKFRPAWQDSMPERDGDLCGGNEAYHQNNGTRRGPASAITRAICSQLENIPEVKENAALNSVYASTELGTLIDHVVVAWAAERCRKAVESNESDDGAPWSNEALRRIKLARQGYEKLLLEKTITTSSTDSEPRGVHSYQQNAMPLNPYVKQPSLSQGPPTSITNEDQGRDGQTRETARPAGLSLLQQANHTAQLPWSQPLQSPRNQGGGGHPRQGAMGPPPSLQRPVAEVGQSLQLPGAPASGTRVVQSPGGRKSLPNGRRNPGQLHPTQKRPKTPPWAHGPVATSGRRR